MDLTKLTNKIQDELASALINLPATSNGTIVMAVSKEATDTFDQYPVIRIVPATVGREIDAEARRYTYTPTYTVSIYLNLEKEEITSEVIATLMELVDLVYNALDNTVMNDSFEHILDLEAGVRCLAGSSIVSEINTVQTKTGTAVYCDIQYPVAVSKGL